MKNLKTNWLLKHTLTVFSCVLIIVFGIVFLSQADPVTTTIGENIATNDLSVTGNVTAGTWQGDLVATEYGGTGADWSAVAQGNLPYFSAEGALSNLAPGTAGQFLKSQGTGADPAWANVTRSATFVVAANDSSTLSKQQADYVCDGTDDQDTISNAITALPDNGGKIILLEGIYNFTGVVYTSNILTITKSNVVIEGQGKATQIKVVGNEGQYVIYFNGVQNCVVRDVWVNGNDLGGYAIQFTDSSECKVLNCIVGNTWADGIVGTNLSYSFIKGNIVYDCQTNGHGDSSSGIEIEDGCNYINIADNYLSECTYGIWIKRHSGRSLTHNISIVRNILYESKLYLTSEDANPIENINVTGNTLLGETTSESIIMSGVTMSTIRDNTLHSPVHDYGGISINNTCSLILVDGNRIYNASTEGIYGRGLKSVISNNYITNAGSNGISAYNDEGAVIGNRVMDSGGRGIYVGGSNITVTGNVVKNSGTTESNRAGIRIYNTHDIVTSNNICFDDQDTKTQTYGIEIDEWSGECDNITVAGNNVVGNKTKGIYVNSNSNENGIVRDNIGYTTESSGTATLANATTSIAVTHGLAVTPSAGDITITPIEAWGAMTEFYIDTYTSTQFTIHADQDPGQDVDFAWKAIVL